MASYRIISSDNHVVEPPDLWVSRGPSKFKDRMPHAVSNEEGDLWFCEGQQIGSTAAGGNGRTAVRRPGENGHHGEEDGTQPPGELRSGGARERPGHRRG